MLEKLNKHLSWLWYGVLAIVLLDLLWDDFPTLWAASSVMAALYGVMALFSLILGIGSLRPDTHSTLWDSRGVPEDTQKRYARLMGGLFLVNAAIGPVGLLVSLAVDFDTDFLLLAQMGGLAAIGLLGLLPRGNKTARG